MANIEDKLQQMGITIPPVPKPVAAYIPARKAGNLVFVSGQGPAVEGEFVHVGKVGVNKTVQEGYEAARICALNCLAALKDLVGSLDQVEEIVQVRGFVNCAPDFGEQPEVINGASELLLEIFGDAGKHARAALGTSSLPRDITVEVEIVARVRDA
jgi:enamine deaminase RidA (YjgF/YER057c/UK114 family)